MSNFVVLSINANSLVRPGRVVLLKKLICEINPSIAMIQETHFDELNKFFVTGYNVFRNNVKRGWSGTAIIVDSNIPVRNLKTTTMGVHSVAIECKLGMDWFRFASIYFPHNLLRINDIESFFQTNNNTFFGGDTNARHGNVGDLNGNMYGNVLNDMAANGDIQIFNSVSPTCFRSNHGSFIDKFISNSDICPFGSVDSVESFSDHGAIRCVLPFDVSEVPLENSNLLCFNSAPVERINKFIELNFKRQVIPVRSNIRNGDCELIVVNFSDICNRAVINFLPVKKQGSRVLMSKTALEVRAALKKKQRKLFRLGRGISIPTDIANKLRSDIGLLKTMLLNTIASDANKFFMDAYGSIQCNTVSFRVIRRFTSHKSRESPPNMLYNDNGKINNTIGSANISNLLAAQFISNNELTLNVDSSFSGDVFDSNMSVSNNNDYIKFCNDIGPDIRDFNDLRLINNKLPAHQFGLLTCTEEVIEVVRSRPNKNSTCSDLLPYTLMKTFNDEILRGITILFIHLIAVSYFPVAWQHAIITPIPKPNKDKSVVKNWRPISVLLCISKIFEGILAKRINIHTSKCNIFENQFGFLSNNSTIHALANLQNQINEGLNNGRVTTLVALDLQAAFDTVWWDGVVHKMIGLNYTMIIIKMIKSFLGHRSFSVRLANDMSFTRYMLAGVPQGSVLGPIIFNIY